MNRLIDAYQVFRLHRKHRNSFKHSAIAAWRIAIVGLPF